MKKRLFFFCDICGTFDSKINNNEYLKQVDYFFYQLNILGNQLGAEEIMFSFVSNDSKDDVFNKVLFIKPFLEKNNIISNINFFNDGSIVHNNITYSENNFKAIKILNYLKEMEKDTEFIKIIFADDTYYNHYILEDILKEQDEAFFAEYVEQIMPNSSYGIVSLNEKFSNLISSYLINTSCTK